MARQRFIWPTLWDDPDIGRLDPLAQLLYIGCFSLADDDGRIHGEPEHLKASVFRYRRVSVNRVRELRDEVAAACHQFRVYEVAGVEYIAFANWSDFQKPKYPKPSKLPPPPGYRKRRKPAPPAGKSSGNDSGNDSPNGSGNDSGSSSATGLGRDGLGLKPGLERSEDTPPHVWQEGDPVDPITTAFMNEFGKPPDKTSQPRKAAAA